MGFAELLLLAVGLSMDAFAVSVCKGLATGKVRLRHMLCVGIWFGGFQALMPTLGYLLGAAFQAYITAVDHWVAFVLLAFIGGNMIKESFSKEESCADASFGFRTMLLMALATSIDACGGGHIRPAAGCEPGGCGGVHWSDHVPLSAIGIKAGSIFGGRCPRKGPVGRRRYLDIDRVKDPGRAWFFWPAESGSV